MLVNSSSRRRETAVEYAHAHADADVEIRSCNLPWPARLAPLYGVRGIDCLPACWLACVRAAAVPIAMQRLSGTALPGLAGLWWAARVRRRFERASGRAVRAWRACVRGVGGAWAVVPQCVSCL